MNSAYGLRFARFAERRYCPFFRKPARNYYWWIWASSAAGGVAAALYTAYPMADLIPNIQAVISALSLYRKQQDPGKPFEGGGKYRMWKFSGTRDPYDWQRAWYCISSRSLETETACCQGDPNALACIQQEIFTARWCRSLPDFRCRPATQIGLTPATPPMHREYRHGPRGTPSV